MEGPGQGSKATAQRSKSFRVMTDSFGFAGRMCSLLGFGGA